jgi:hypothetical protein
MGKFGRRLHTHRLPSQAPTPLSARPAAEVVLGTVRDLSLAIAWLKTTFLYTRIRHNPRHYGCAGLLRLRAVAPGLLLPVDGRRCKLCGGFTDPSWPHLPLARLTLAPGVAQSEVDSLLRDHLVLRNVRGREGASTAWAFLDFCAAGHWEPAGWPAPALVVCPARLRPVWLL